MIRVLIEVRRNEATTSNVIAQGRSVQEAVSIAAAVYPDADIKVKFPIDAEAFFVNDPAVRAEIVSFERADGMTA
jgi:hypothetical protein